MLVEEYRGGGGGNVSKNRNGEEEEEKEVLKSFLQETVANEKAALISCLV